jgi:Holliday junction resolvasome RuvABC endonuclease subunit
MVVAINQKEVIATMYYLGLDLGLHCGHTVLDSDGGIIETGTVTLGGSVCGASLCCLREIITTLITSFTPIKVGYESVMQFHKSRASASAFGAYEAVIKMVCFDLNVELIGLSCKSIKKHATNDGNADKLDMEYAFLQKYGKLAVDDNAADSAFVADLMRVKHG